MGKNKKTVLAWVYSHDFEYEFTRKDGTKCVIGNGLKLTEHSYIKNEFVSAFESLILQNPQRVVWAGDYAARCPSRKSNVYSRCTDKTKVIPSARPTLKETRYILNHTKKLFVDKNKAPKGKGEDSAYQVHPLPLLTCEGCGQGGGDYSLENSNIGVWARDLISVDSKVPDGFKELVPNFEME